MQAAKEREGFSRRLRDALDHAGWRAIGPTGLAREYNQRNRASKVTLHATRKWLNGEAIPTQVRVRALAQWLEVPADWLRFGDGPAPAGRHQVSEVATRAGEQVATDTYARHAFLSDVEKLTADQLWVVRELVKMLLKQPRVRR